MEEELQIAEVEAPFLTAIVNTTDVRISPSTEEAIVQLYSISGKLVATWEDDEPFIVQMDNFDGEMFLFRELTADRVRKAKYSK